MNFSSINLVSNKFLQLSNIDKNNYKKFDLSQAYLILISQLFFAFNKKLYSELRYFYIKISTTLFTWTKCCISKRLWLVPD